jgi:hypothetical protein
MKRISQWSITPTMTRHSLGVVATMVLSIAALAGQAPPAVDTSKLGPQVGATVPSFTGVDQFDKPHSLASIYGPKGAMLVFFRSADW